MNLKTITTLLTGYQFSSVAQSFPTLCDPMDCSTPPCPSPAPGVYSNSCPLSWWCHLTIPSSVVPFSSCPQSFPASGSFQMSQFFTSGGQSIGILASTSVLPMNIRDWFPLGWTGWISLAVQGLYSNTKLLLVAQSCPTLCGPMDCSMPGFPVLHHLPELAQTHVHWVGDAIQPSHPLSSPSPPAFYLSQHLFQWVGSPHQVVKVLKLQLQHQSWQWIFRVDFL